MRPHWVEEYEEDQASRSKFVKNKPGVPVETEFLSNEPEKKEFTKDGKTITSWNFPVKVMESGKQREKTLSVTSSRLMRLIIEEARKAPLQGRTFIITAIGDGLQRMWTIAEVKK
jgi:hypothetical protein